MEICVFDGQTNLGSNLDSNLVLPHDNLIQLNYLVTLRLLRSIKWGWPILFFKDITNISEISTVCQTLYYVF